MNNGNKKKGKETKRKAGKKIPGLIMGKNQGIK